MAPRAARRRRSPLGLLAALSLACVSVAPLAVSSLRRLAAFAAGDGGGGRSPAGRAPASQASGGPRALPPSGAGAEAAAAASAGVGRRSALGSALLPLGVAAASCSGPGRAAELCDDACLLKILGGNFEATDRSAEREIFLSTSADTIAYTYGTIRPQGVRAILSHLSIDESDVLTDVGSGCGNVAVQVFANTPVRRVRGIEFIKSRHQDAVQHGEAFKKAFKVDPSRELQFVNGDLCREDYSDSTVVFANSLCFTDALMDCLRRSCEANRNLKYLITQKRLGTTSLRYLGDLVNVSTSWSQSAGEPYRIYTNMKGVQLASQDGVEMVRA